MMVERLTIEQLKEVLRVMKQKDKSILLTGKKADIIERYNKCTAYTDDEKLQIIKETIAVKHVLTAVSDIAISNYSELKNNLIREMFNDYIFMFDGAVLEHSNVEHMIKCLEQYKGLIEQCSNYLLCGKYMRDLIDNLTKLLLKSHIDRSDRAIIVTESIFIVTGLALLQQAKNIKAKSERVGDLTDDEIKTYSDMLMHD